MADKKITPEEAKENTLKNRATGPAESKIEKDRLALKIPTPDDYKTAASRKALGNLNMKNANRDASAVDLEAERKKKAGLSAPVGFKKGGMVKKTGMALVHKGEKVLTKKQQAKRGPRKRA